MQQRKKEYEEQERHQKIEDEKKKAADRLLELEKEREKERERLLKMEEERKKEWQKKKEERLVYDYVQSVLLQYICAKSLNVMVWIVWDLNNYYQKDNHV